ncbi:hypothetical protein SS21_04910 [Enterobacter roggenkampii]|uniref:hypothetical protein n=1 Tax=Enterobacter roggenkampii TaxID=1812935 RepID=UPI0005ED926A|nr:hypothetical protein [Enterobacter roggenkampii]KJM90621.1 hypothetical protein SS21_04910 [Enterobacter roggenkampii]KJN60081.1 hypothetical protein SS51_02505 [Enterobacter roggenkampii]WIJ48535.1 hypothetical protein OI984_19975 [Enterobacter roggenkampii]WIJ77655.1 hypothetical protein OI980_18840 [Enterobacter roggenkampii]
MDILNLLEVLKPSGNVVTVKIDNAKNGFEALYDFIITLAPTIIAIVAIIASYYQFLRSMNQQQEQFSKGIDQQIDTLQLNVKLATEVELKKENCRGVREACIKLLSHATDAYTRRAANIKYSVIPDNKKTDYDWEQMNLTSDAYLSALKRFRDTEYLIETYLDEKLDAEFSESIKELDECIRSENFSGKDNKAAKRKCLSLCQAYIKRQQTEIVELPNTILSNKRNKT